MVWQMNTTIHINRTIKMKPVGVEDNTYIDSNKEVNDKDCKFKAGDRLRISKHKKHFC